ncbi:hypothetical protein [Streptomyces sp. NPDC087270]|uniref:hypothetical protein n=1 Tax=Streptomyces sp. NPDC087270 TaxID=3365774 RepID=UPI0037F93E79
MRIRIAVVSVAALVALAGCSSSHHHDDAGTATPATAVSSSGSTPTAISRATPSGAAGAGKDELVAAVRTYSTAYFAPDADKGYAMLSERCQAKTDKHTYGQELQQSVTAYGHQKLKTVTVDRLSGTLGTVTYTYDNSLLDQDGQAWALENGAWRYDAC